MFQGSVKDKQNVISQQKINPQELPGGAPRKKSNKSTNQQPLSSTPETQRGAAQGPV